MSYAYVQSTEGTRVTNGTSISATYGSNVGAGHLLVAIISRSLYGSITAMSVSGSTVTVTASNTLVSGAQVGFVGLGGGFTGMNNNIYTVLSTGLSTSQFEVTVAGQTNTTTTGTYLADVVAMGEVTDNHGNKWKQVAETAYNGVVAGIPTVLPGGLDIRICESAGGGNAPVVTATTAGANVGPAIQLNGLNMWIGEYSGNSGNELTDQAGTAQITSTASPPVVTVTTFNNMTANHDLAISAVTGNMTAATVPSSWTSRLADTTQQFWVADQTDTGTSSGSTYSAAWTALTAGVPWQTGHAFGSGLVICFKEAGTTNAPTLLQSLYYNYSQSASATTTVQTFPVNPTAGNTLFALINGLTTGPILCQQAIGLTDTAGNTWEKIFDSPQDGKTGVNWSMWICQSALGGTTTPTVTFAQPLTSVSSILAEVQGMLSPVILDRLGLGISLSQSSVSTSAAVLANDFGMAVFNWLLGVPMILTSGWTSLMGYVRSVLLSVLSPNSSRYVDGHLRSVTHHSV